MRARVVAALLLAVLAGPGSVRFGAALAAPPRKPTRYALLVACTRYDHVPEVYHLAGPGNDARLLHDLLRDRYHFPEDHITTLSEKAAEAHGPAYRPTYADIAREFRRLALVAGPGDRVVIAMAGHGSQEPNTRPDDPTRFKPDGLEQIFLPADVPPAEQWDGAAGKVKNAIADYEFRDWLHAIRQKGASVWVILDACHSAAMVRAGPADGEKARQIPADQLVPQRILDRAAERARAQTPAAGQPGSAEAPPPFALPPDEPDLVAFYAAQATESTYEKLLPPGDPKAEVHGLLTYCLCATLSQAQTPLTYAELLRRIQDQYLAWGRTYPTPLVEGKDRNRIILGDEEILRPSIRLRREGADWVIDAGSLTGLTTGTVLAIYPPPGGANDRTKLGHVRIFEGGLGLTASEVQPCAFDQLPAPATLMRGARCEPAFVDCGDLRLSVAVGDTNFRGQAVPPDVRHHWIATLDQLARAPGALFRQASTLTQAQWVLRVDASASGRIYLIPAGGLRKDYTDERPTSDLPSQFGPVPSGDEGASWLKESLERIARAQNFLAIASRASHAAGSGDDSGPKIQVEVVRFHGGDDKMGEPVPTAGPGAVLYKGDDIGIRVLNQGQDPADVTILLVNSRFGIEAFYPTGVTVDNRVPAGNRRQLRGKITTTTVGLEHLIVIAVKAREEIGEYANFSFLAQPSVREVRRGLAGKDRALDSDLGRLFQSAFYAHGRTRGVPAQVLGEVVFSRHSWHVSPARRPPMESRPQK